MESEVELRSRRVEVVRLMETMNDAREVEGRQFTEDESQDWACLMEQYTELSRLIDPAFECKSEAAVAVLLDYQRRMN